MKICSCVSSHKKGKSSAHSTGKRLKFKPKHRLGWKYRTIEYGGVGLLPVMLSDSLKMMTVMGSVWSHLIGCSRDAQDAHKNSTISSISSNYKFNCNTIYLICMSNWAFVRTLTATAYAISFVCTLSLPHLHEITSPWRQSECRWPQHRQMVKLLAIATATPSYTSILHHKQQQLKQNIHIQCRRQNQMVFAYPHNTTAHSTNAVFCSKLSYTHLSRSHTHTCPRPANLFQVARTNEIAYVFLVPSKCCYFIVRNRIIASTFILQLK